MTMNANAIINGSPANSLVRSEEGDDQPVFVPCCLFCVYCDKTEEVAEMMVFVIEIVDVDDDMSAIVKSTAVGYCASE